jgi:hypothetical protein
MLYSVYSIQFVAIQFFSLFGAKGREYTSCYFEVVFATTRFMFCNLLSMTRGGRQEQDFRVMLWWGIGAWVYINHGYGKANARLVHTRNTWYYSNAYVADALRWRRMAFTS